MTQAMELMSKAVYVRVPMQSQYKPEITWHREYLRETRGENIIWSGGLRSLGLPKKEGQKLENMYQEMRKKGV